MRKARVTGKALRRQLLEGEARLLVLPVLVAALRRVLGGTREGTPEKVEAQRYVLAMALQGARVRGEQTERLLDALALLGRLKLLGVEAPEHLSKRLEDGAHRGLQVTLGARPRRSRAPGGAR